MMRVASMRERSVMSCATPEYCVSKESRFKSVDRRRTTIVGRRRSTTDDDRRHDNNHHTDLREVPIEERERGIVLQKIIFFSVRSFARFRARASAAAHRSAIRVAPTNKDVIFQKNKPLRFSICTSANRRHSRAQRTREPAGEQKIAQRRCSFASFVNAIENAGGVALVTRSK